MASKRTPKRKESKGIDLKPYMIVIGFLLLALTTYIGLRIQSSSKRLVPISVLALIAGIIYEGKRLSEKWSTVLLITLGSYALSFFAFLPGKRENVYNFENHVIVWPYCFVMIFAILSIVFYGEKIVPKLTEGITLMQSIAVIYWVIDYGFVDINNLLLKSIMIIGLLFPLFSIFHAFTHATLSRSSRLTLSIWSSIIMMLFAVDHIYRVYQNEEIENMAHISHGIYIGIQYFLLGVSSIYIVQNFFMLIRFLPGRGTFFNEQYFRELNDLKDEHIKRYSNKQVSIQHSFFCVLFTCIIFILNHYYQVLPRHTAIWIVFVIFPFLLMIYDYMTGRKTT